jgi:myo-inositol 2-dehydrogenase/D-chiro-inositol 1-dehydrogenase/scyllo-inositol 2-dehydrogenase (NAD+)
VLATPPAGHEQQTLIAARHGKHVFIEKPMAQNVAECRRMVEACEGAGVRLGIVSQHRFRASDMAAKKLIDEGAIGRVTMVRCLGPEVGWWDTEKTQDQWKLDPAQQTAYASWAAHGCDMLRWYVGDEAVLAFAQFAHYSQQPPPDRSAMATYRFAGDVLSHIWMSYDIPAPGLGSAMQLLIVGTRGMVDYDSYGAVRLGRGEGWETVFTQGPFDPTDPTDPRRLEGYARHLNDFADAIRDGRAPSVSGHDGVHVVAMLDAAELSAKTNRSVVIDPVTSAISLAE